MLEEIENILIGFDQLINTITYVYKDGFGKPDETLSARAWRLRDYSSAYKIINLIFFWQRNHCFESYISEKLRKQLPREYQI